MDALIFSAFWLGILTAISPCPLATNTVAISFIGRRVGEKQHVIRSGLLYSVGRTLAYSLIGVVVITGLVGNAEISRFFQKYMNEALGPILILLGLVLLGWMGAGISFNMDVEKWQERAENGGAMWAVPIGFVFALSFCPISAGLFFGGLIPLALQQQSIILFPVAYAIGTSLPVVLFAFLMAYGSAYVGTAFDRLTQVEVWIRRIAGTLSIAVGLYYSFIYIYGVSL